MKYKILIMKIKNILNRSDITSTEKYLNSKNLVLYNIRF